MTNPSYRESQPRQESWSRQEPKRRLAVLSEEQIREEQIREEQIREEQIAALVHAFYDKIRQHEELGPIFDGALHGAWGPHLDKMVSFWMTMMTDAKTYDGRPLPVHLGLSGLQDRHFGQWLALFRETARDLFDEQKAGQFIERAERMAQSFRYVMALREGRPLPPVADMP